MGQRAGESEPDARRWPNREAQAQAGTREGRRRLVEELTEALRGARSMRGAKGSQRDVQLGVAGADVARGGFAECGIQSLQQVCYGFGFSADQSHACVSCRRRPMPLSTSIISVEYLSNRCREEGCASALLTVPTKNWPIFTNSLQPVPADRDINCC